MRAKPLAFPSCVINTASWHQSSPWPPFPLLQSSFRVKRWVVFVSFHFPRPGGPVDTSSGPSPGEEEKRLQTSRDSCSRYVFLWNTNAPRVRMCVSVCVVQGLGARSFLAHAPTALSIKHRRKRKHLSTRPGSGLKFAYPALPRAFFNGSMRAITWWARGEEASPPPTGEEGGGIVFEQTGILVPLGWSRSLVSFSGLVLSGLREGLVSCPWSWPFNGRRQVVGKKVTGKR
ncbi:uncharacterized protein LY79DRAFT_244765 [Colletotrichum navitas]|uniref:Uncharacterized protein n=1 Tax=Colletotrichum navitas TaxID=681940 RepID=A0AAD8V4K5_9PEZI|nr:uncharacterized protein LY79DRAFT_244765 [Colletotrichum navitas]KAK1586030.1 hypothetical protein LY79DRAFT_244765 [Colletotrichum navitas]